MANFNCVSWQRPKNVDGTHIITRSDKPATPQPSSIPSWSQVLSKLIDYSLSNMIKIAGIISLGVGGLLFLIYFWSISFMPEMNVQTLVIILAFSAATGSIVFIMISLGVVFPGYIWAQWMKDLKPLQSPFWFVLPIAAAILGFIMSVFWLSEGNIQEIIEKEGLISGLKWFFLAILFIFCAPVLRIIAPLVLDSIRSTLKKSNYNYTLHENLVYTDMYIYKVYTDMYICKPWLISTGHKILRERQKQLGKDRFWQKLNIWRNVMKVGQNIKILVTFYISFIINIIFFIFPMFYLIFKIVLSDPYFNKSLNLAGTMLFLNMYAILSINLIVIKVLSENKNSVKAILISCIIGMVGISLILANMKRLTLIPNYVMNIYKFGNIHHASLVLDEMGCTIANNHRLLVRPYPPDFTTQTTPNPKTCLLSNVTIHSRLGTVYYLETFHPESSNRTDGPLINFTMPGQNVLSWAVDKPKVDKPK